MHQLLRYTAVILLGVFCSGSALGNEHPPFTYLTVQDGLSNNSVTSIFQDHRGFMWFGTFDGLNRYDGYSFRVFRNKVDDSTSLSGSRVVAMEEDSRNRMWIGTKGGISIFSNSAEGFYYASYRPCATPDSLRNMTTPVKDLKRDKKGNMFIATDGVGLLMAPEGGTEAIQIPMQASGECAYSAQAIRLDERGDVWVLVNGQGLHKYDTVSKNLRLVSAEVSSVNALEADSSGNLWIGTPDNGIFRFRISSQTYTAHFNTANGLRSNRIIAFSTDQENKLWIATDGGGVNVLDINTGKFQHYLPGTGKQSINSSAIYAIYNDREQRKWIGTLRGGINILDQRRANFTTIARDPADPNSLVNDFVLSFEEDAQGNWWIGTDGGGMSFWNKEKNRFTNYISKPGVPGSLSSNFITNICIDQYEDVWVATYGGGINRFRKKTGDFEQYIFSDNPGNPNRDVWIIYEDSRKNLWAGTIGGSLYRLNRDADVFEVFDAQLSNMLSMTEDKNGILWGGNFNSLIRMDIQNRKYEFFHIGRPVRTVHVNEKEEIWLATEGNGLMRFLPEEKRFLTYSTEQGLANPSVLTLLEDDAGNLWMSTFSGISMFSKKKEKFTNYDESDGLQSNQFNYNAALKTSTGAFVFGGLNGFNVFFPDSLHQYIKSPEPFITALKLGNEPVFSHHRYVTESDLNEIKTLRVPFDKASFSFEMAAPEYTAPEKIEYAYYLEGWDQQWNFSGKQRTGLYSSLTEGNYTLKVKNTNANGDWGEEKVLLRIQVLSPWYRSWWAYLLYISVIGAIIYSFWMYKTRQTRLEYEVMVARINAENEKELSAKDRELNEKRLSFFTSISHEFRTPLTLIINPVRDLLVRFSGEEGKELNIINRNASRLLSLVDQLLLFRKTESGLDSLNITRFHFETLCREVFRYFEYEANSKHIQYHFHNEASDSYIYGDRNKLEIVLYNIVHNALKYTPDGKSVDVFLEEEENNWVVKVKDTGHGIPKETGDKVFERFFQANASGGKMGFGIGLYLVKQFVQEHSGAISYTSEPGAGTEFRLVLKKGKKHFGNIPVTENATENPSANTVLPPPPLHKEDPGKENEPEIPATPEVSSKKVLLVADDDEEIRTYIKDLFSTQYIIYEALNGSEAWEIVQKKNPDMVISDIMMPEMTGIELCRLIKTDPVLNHIPVVLLTALSSEDVRLKGTEEGADDYVTKPFSRELLVARVENILRNRNHLQQYFFDEITLKKNDVKVPPEYKAFLEECIAVVEKHIDDDEFSIRVMAKEMGMSHSNLYKRVKHISGQSATAFIRFIRLRRAAYLFIETADNVNEVAAQVGFNDIKYFREQFNKLFGMNPSAYIRKYRKLFGKGMQVNHKKS